MFKARNKVSHFAKKAFLANLHASPWLLILQFIFGQSSFWDGLADSLACMRTGLLAPNRGPNLGESKRSPEDGKARAVLSKEIYYVSVSIPTRRSPAEVGRINDLFDPFPSKARKESLVEVLER